MFGIPIPLRYEIMRWGYFALIIDITIEKHQSSCMSVGQFGSSIFNERKDGTGAHEWSEFPTKAVVELNDTHPTLAILMILLMHFRFKLIRKTESYITPNEITVTGLRSPRTKEHVTPAPKPAMIL
ncbi:alpha-glucan phosphorylase, H isozyme [Tanacetum coccineum]